MALSNSLPDLSNIYTTVSKSFSNLQLPLVLLSAVCRRILLELVHFVGAIANSIAILICYVYLKNFRRHSIIIVDGYITVFKLFAEFISAISCLCFGIMEVDIVYTLLGLFGIAMGLFLKGLLLYGEQQKQSQFLKVFTYSVCAFYIACVLGCSFAFHNVAMTIGILPCVARILTCIVPLVALSEFFRVSGQMGQYFSYLADIAAVCVLWWYCSHLSLKYFVLVPSVIGLVFSFIQYVLVEIQKLTSREIESDIYKRE